MSRRTKVLLGGASFGVATAIAIALLTGSSQVGLHAAFWIALVFTVWLESRLAE